jgi:hypothetical protein
MMDRNLEGGSHSIQIIKPNVGGTMGLIIYTNHFCRSQETNQRINRFDITTIGSVRAARLSC